MIVLQGAIKLPSMLSGEAPVGLFMRQSKSVIYIYLIIYEHFFFFFLQDVCGKLLLILNFHIQGFHNSIEISYLFLFIYCFWIL